MTRALRAIALYLILVAFFVATVFPLVWMFYTAGKTNAEVTVSRWALPASVNFANLLRVFDVPPDAGFLQGARAAFASRLGRYFLNSLWISALAVFLSTAVSAVAAFAFARLRFLGSGALFVVFILGMMIPVHVTLVPLVRLFGWCYAPATLVMVYIGFALPVSIFILRGFFSEVPVELDEAARIDGCSTWGVFWHVYLPLARPALAVVVIFNFIAIYNEFIFALVLLHRTSEKTLPVGLRDFSGPQGAADIPLLCAALVAATLPVLLAYLLAQRHIVKGLTAGAIKG